MDTHSFRWEGLVITWRENLVAGLIDSASPSKCAFTLPNCCLRRLHAAGIRGYRWKPHLPLFNHSLSSSPVIFLLRFIPGYYSFSFWHRLFQISKEHLQLEGHCFSKEGESCQMLVPRMRLEIRSPVIPGWFCWDFLTPGFWIHSGLYFIFCPLFSFVSGRKRNIVACRGCSLGCENGT